MRTNKDYISSVVEVLKEQGKALQELADKVDPIQYEKALSLMAGCTGHVVVTGMGKSGLIGQKISATLASTGCPSFYLHPAEAFHGDLGRITKGDVVLMISNSGETDELLKLIPSLNMFGSKVISITNCLDSTLAKSSDAVLSLQMEREVCPNNLAPTTSTTLTTAIGDALAIALVRESRFMPEDFARFHPGGALGRQLLTEVGTIMSSSNLPIVKATDTLRDVMLVMTTSSIAGVAVAVDSLGFPVGILTDGDIRRAFSGGDVSVNVSIRELMSKNPVLINSKERCVTAKALMKDERVKSLIVTCGAGMVVGLLDIHMV